MCIELFSPEKTTADIGTESSQPALVSPSHLHPSPSKMRMRKSRHRRNNSKSGISTSATSPVKSPTKDALHDELQSNTVLLRPVDRTKVSSSTFNFLGPATALRELGSPTERRPSRDLQLDARSYDCDSNVNDVCFSCEGQCSDMTCSSKETTPSRESVTEAESCTCESSQDTTPSPLSPRENIVNIVEFQNNKNHSKSKLQTSTCSQNSSDSNSQSQLLYQMDSNENLKSSCITMNDSDAPVIEITKGDNMIVDYTSKRNFSDVEFSPSSPISPQLVDMEEDNFVGQSSRSGRFRDTKVSF